MSEELDELLALSDRIVALYGGGLVGELAGRGDHVEPLAASCWAKRRRDGENKRIAAAASKALHSRSLSPRSSARWSSSSPATIRSTSIGS